MKQGFVVTFIFTPSFSHVLLIQKNRPEWQKGKLNGLGGHIEEGESFIQCGTREIREESGLIIPEKDWIYAGEIQSIEWNCHILTTTYHGQMSDIQTITDEKVNWYEVDNLPSHIISNLSWQILFCKDKLNNKYLKELTVTYDPF